MLNADIHSITETDLQTLIDDRVPEGDTLEYKGQLNLATNGAKLEFLKDVSSFANSKGGDMIFGIEENNNDHKPDKLTALINFNLDEWQRRIVSLATTHLEDRLYGLQFKDVPLKNGGSAMVLRIPHSWSSPHIIKLEDEYRFYARVGNQRQRMSLPELRNRFLLTGGIAARMRDFRSQRLAKIVTHDMPAAMPRGAFAVLHLLPLASFSQTVDVDLARLRTSPGNAVPILTGRGWSPGYNFDGFICEVNEGGKDSHSYIQVFRNGCIEAVDSVLVRDFENNARFDSEMEVHLAQALERYLRLLFDLYIEPPYFVMLSLINVKGGYIYRNDPFRFHTQRLDRNELLFPEEMVTEHGADPLKVLKKTFDVLWQSCGFERCPNYDKSGARIKER